MSSCLLCFFLLHINQVLIAQESSFEAWGIGIVTGPFVQENLPINTVLEALSGLIIFDAPDGIPIGKLTGADGLQMSCNAQVIEVDSKDLREYTYGLSGLIYFEEKQGYLRMFNHSYSGGVWVRRSELTQHDWKSLTWMDFLMAGNTLFPESLNINMNLRAKPEAASQLLVKLSDDRFFITPTGKSQGLWAEVKVVQYEEPYCSGNDKVIGNWTGWVKLLDDKGHPNLWYYTRGC